MVQLILLALFVSCFTLPFFFDRITSNINLQGNMMRQAAPGKTSYNQLLASNCAQAIDKYFELACPIHTLTTSHRRTWRALSSQLELLRTHFDLSSNLFNENQLSLLTIPEDEAFLHSILGGKRVSFRFDAGELGHIGLARLYAMRDTYKNQDLRLFARTQKAIKFAVTNENFDHNRGMFHFDISLLRAEVYNLLIHARDFPDKKIVWLGTGNAVVNYKNEHLNEGTFFNCPSDKITWALNRAYLHIAADLGYTFMLVEPQLPNIENAILSGQASVFIVELIREMRPQVQPNAWVTTQYDGGDQPTATNHECLFLLDKNIKPVKRNGRIFFTPAPILKNSYENTILPSYHFERGRAHSFSASSDLSKAPVQEKFDRDNLFRAPIIK